MRKSNSNLLFFAIGSAVGTAIGYLIASDKKEEWLQGMSNVVGRIKQNIKSSIAKEKEDLEDLIEDED